MVGNTGYQDGANGSGGARATFLAQTSVADSVGKTFGSNGSGGGSYKTEFRDGVHCLVHEQTGRRLYETAPVTLNGHNSARQVQDGFVPFNDGCAAQYFESGGNYFGVRC